MTDKEHDPFSDFLYPFLEEQEQAPLPQILSEVRESTLAKAREVTQMRQAFIAEEAPALVAAAQAMATAFAQGGQLLTFGNGGSATDAQDLAADCLHPVSGGAASERMALPALSLTNDIGVVTAVGNDVGYDNVFARQVIAYGRPGDMALGFSTSGESANVLAALRQAQKDGLLTVGIAGYDGGKMAAASLDHCFVVRSSYVPRIQEVHATIYHTLLQLCRRLLTAESEAARRERSQI